jgi:hypothetical protein
VRPLTTPVRSVTQSSIPMSRRISSLFPSSLFGYWSTCL